MVWRWHAKQCHKPKTKSTHLKINICLETGFAFNHCGIIKDVWFSVIHLRKDEMLLPN